VAGFHPVDPRAGGGIVGAGGVRHSACRCTCVSIARGPQTTAEKANVFAARMLILMHMGSGPAMTGKRVRRQARWSQPAAFACRRLTVQNELGIPVRLRAPFQDQIAGGLKRRTLELRRHRPVSSITRVLTIHHLRHPPQCRHHLLSRCHAMVQPVGDMLRTDAQRRAILHQPDVMNVRHLGAADPLINPPHHIAQYALTVVVEFLLDVLGRPVGPIRNGNGQQIGQLRALA